MANPTTIILPISMGDTIYEKHTKIKTCQYFGDKYAREDGQPNCREHEYDCTYCGQGCDAVFEYSTTPVEVNDIIMEGFAWEAIKGCPYEYASERYLLTEKEAADWVSSHNE